MPAWPGGDCPTCGEWMPPAMVHCRNCRTLLNPELESDSVEIPEFVPLREIDAMVELQPVGYYLDCPACGEELRIRAKYVGQKVQCKHCEGRFVLDIHAPPLKPQAFFAGCPYCSKELRMARKYLGQRVACKFCGGHIQLAGP